MSGLVTILVTALTSSTLATIVTVIANRRMNQASAVKVASEAVKIDTDTSAVILEMVNSAAEKATALYRVSLSALEEELAAARREILSLRQEVARLQRSLETDVQSRQIEDLIRDLDYERQRVAELEVRLGLRSPGEVPVAGGNPNEDDAT